jgi:hypothetical protein
MISIAGIIGGINGLTFKNHFFEYFVERGLFALSGGYARKSRCRWLIAVPPTSQSVPCRIAEKSSKS